MARPNRLVLPVMFIYTLAGRQGFKIGKHEFAGKAGIPAGAAGLGQAAQRPSRSFQTIHMASKTMLRLILLCPTRRSANTIGVSTMRNPRL